MIDPIFQSDNYQIARKLLDASVVRQEAISSNIANAETPGYRRIDLATNFSSELKACMQSSGSADMDSLQSLRPRISEDPFTRSTRPDGNNVEIEKELLEMNRNTVEYEYLTELISRNIKQLRMAITGRSY